jgi:Sec-independent protein secretion pathway component TatC
MNDEEKIPFTSHLEELRKRLIICFIAIGIGFVLAYSVKEWLFHLLTAPLISIMQPDEKLIFTSLPEAFFTYLKVAFCPESSWPFPSFYTNSGYSSLQGFTPKKDDILPPSWCCPYSFL